MGDLNSALMVLASVAAGDAEGREFTADIAGVGGNQNVQVYIVNGSSVALLHVKTEAGTDTEEAVNAPSLAKNKCIYIRDVSWESADGYEFVSFTLMCDEMIMHFVYLVADDGYTIKLAQSAWSNEDQWNNMIVNDFDSDVHMLRFNDYVLMPYYDINNDEVVEALSVEGSPDYVKWSAECWNFPFAIMLRISCGSTRMIQFIPYSFYKSGHTSIDVAVVLNSDKKVIQLQLDNDKWSGDSNKHEVFSLVYEVDCKGKDSTCEFVNYEAWKWVGCAKIVEANADATGYYFRDRNVRREQE